MGAVCQGHKRSGAERTAYYPIPKWTIDDNEEETGPQGPAASSFGSMEGRTKNASRRSLARESSNAKPLGISDELWRSRVAAGKAIALMSRKDQGFASIDRGSVYGAAVALPQIARTAGWPLRYTGFVIRSYLFLALNLFLQGFLLYMLSKEERIMARYAGQPHLCDFGAGIRNCPGGPDCLGPGGTTFTPERLYDWNLWSTRVYVRDAFKELFPEKANEIDEKVDPGEYGVESYYLRIACCFLFILGLWPDLIGTFEVAKLLFAVPKQAQPWMEFELPETEAEQDAARGCLDELDWIKFKVAGMPTHWKAFNTAVVFMPKMYIWLLTVDVGVTFLLETSVIEDMIINAVALAFILSIDEILNCALVDPITRQMLERMEDYPLFDLTEVDSDRHAYDWVEQDRQWSFRSPWLYAEVVPPRFLATCMVASFFIFKYYSQNCVRGPDGGLVSGPVRPPKSGSLSFLSFVFGPWPHLLPVPEESDILWRMPDD